MKWSKSGAASCGGAGFRVPWKLNASLSVRAMPCREPSNSDLWVTLRCAGRLLSSTAKPWFWLVISTVPSSRFCTGWLAP